MEQDENVFFRLAPFIREYIYKNKWEELRAVQVEACKVIFDTDCHLLLASGTASGKTEAAFLPVLTKIHEDPPSSVAVLYIAPIKALINDQFERITGLLEEGGINVFKWHGDVSASHKKKFRDRPEGILQITPESLESMMINRLAQVSHIFSDLRFVIIDEVHSFMGTDRGVQVMCILERIGRLTGRSVRRIGLSATLGDYSLAEKWLASGTDMDVITPKVKMGGQKLKICAEHFYTDQEREQNETDEEDEEDWNKWGKDYDGYLPPVAKKLQSVKEELMRDDEDTGENEINNETDFEKNAGAYWEYIYKKSFGKKCIIFTNLRDHAETAIAMLRQIAVLRGTPDIYHVHHGSISAELREFAEEEMKESELPVVTAATVSLEMGIDVGRLERIIQMEAPWSVSSFLQRLGRSGRRGNPSEMYFVCREDKPNGTVMLPMQIPWRLLQVVAIVQLYVEDRWVEPPRLIKYPFSILYHQLMSIMRGRGEMARDELTQNLLSLSAFSFVTAEELNLLVDYLVNMDHIALTEEKTLIMGLTGEKETGNFKFYAVFPEEDEFTIVYASKIIGRVDNAPPPGERVTLAGRNWQVVSVDNNRREVLVKKMRGKTRTFWNAGNARIHNKILEKMRSVLLCEDEYPYLQPGAYERLREVRFLTAGSRLADINMLNLGGNTVCVLPWMGNIDFHVLLKLIKIFLPPKFGVRDVGGMIPYFMTFKYRTGNIEDFYNEITDFLLNLKNNKNILYEILTDDDVVEMKKNFEHNLPKFDRFIPPQLLKKALIEDYFDIDGIYENVSKWNISEERKYKNG